MRALLALLALPPCTVAPVFGAPTAAGSPPAEPEPAAAPFAQTYLAYVTATAFSQPIVWAAAPDGAQPRILGTGEQPLLAPDGRLVAAALPGGDGNGPALDVYSVAGAPAQPYGNIKSEGAIPLAWSPDSKYLAVSFLSSAVEDMAARSSLAVIDVATGTLTTIAHGLVQGASFAPEGSDLLAYGLTGSFSEHAAVNIHIGAPNGSDARLLTHDGHSLNPLWGSVGIAYDREQPRGRLEFPADQIWLLSPGGGRARQLTHVHVGPLVGGLVPVAFSASSAKLLAEFEGQDTSAAWTVTLASGRARPLRLGEHSLQAAGISQDGSTVLLDEDSFERPPSSGRIVTMPFAGGAPHVLVAHGGQASWNE